MNAIRTIAMLAMLVFDACSAAFGAPELPREFVDATYVPPTGRTLVVPAGGNFQEALNDAQPGDVITLAKGEIFVGSFTLPVKTGIGWIIVRSSASDAELPPLGTRITPSYAPAMPKLVDPGDGSPVLTTAPGAHHFRLIGIEMAQSPSPVHLRLLVEVGSEIATSPADLAMHIIFDRCYIHGDPTRGGAIGVALNSKSTAVIDSYISDFKEVDYEAGAIGGWNGPGPFQIVNNYLEATGINVMFGGADPAIPNLVPSDIEIRGNHFFKPLSWRGSTWTIKNLFELKNAQRVLIDGNLFENNWQAQQQGYAILFTPRNQDGTAPWSIVADVTFQNNIVRHAASGISMLGWDDGGVPWVSRQLQRVLIKNNLFDDINSVNWGGFGALFEIMNGTADVTIDHNTAFVDNYVISAEGGPQNTGFVFSNNIVSHGLYGVLGAGTTTGTDTLAGWFATPVFVKNVLIGGQAVDYPDYLDNFFPASPADVGFVDYPNHDYRLHSDSPYSRRGTDGTDIGADIGMP